MLDFRPTRRRPDYTVKVCIKPIGMRVHNKLDGSYSVVENTNQVVIKGTHDEEWVLDNASW